MTPLNTAFFNLNILFFHVVTGIGHALEFIKILSIFGDK